jgi:hypothetical protein
MLRSTLRSPIHQLLLRTSQKSSSTKATFFSTTTNTTKSPSPPPPPLRQGAFAFRKAQKSSWYNAFAEVKAHISTHRALPIGKLERWTRTQHPDMPSRNPQDLQKPLGFMRDDHIKKTWSEHVQTHVALYRTNKSKKAFDYKYRDLRNNNKLQKKENDLRNTTRVSKRKDNYEELLQKTIFTEQSLKPQISKTSSKNVLNDKELHKSFKKKDRDYTCGTRFRPTVEIYLELQLYINYFIYFFVIVQL